MYHVEMFDLGRNGVSDEAIVERIDYDELRLLVAPHLVSSNISFIFEVTKEGVEEGTVYAGFRPVGKLRITEIKNAVSCN